MTLMQISCGLAVMLTAIGLVRGFHFKISARRSIAEQVKWIESLQFDNGAIRDNKNPSHYNPERYKVTPYFANMAASALCINKRSLTKVENYIKWYLHHLNWPDRLEFNGQKLYGTIYDYYITPQGEESSADHYDSADSYAATFISLLKDYYTAGGNITLIRENEPQIYAIAEIMLILMDSDDLTWAKQDYLIKYLMDNCEVFQGLIAMGYLCRHVFAKPELAEMYLNRAQKVKRGILHLLHNHEFYVYKGLGDFTAVDWNKWYPDSIAQMYPIIFKVIKTDGRQAAYSYHKLSEKWDWVNLKIADDYPWNQMGYVSAMLGKKQAAKDYYKNIKQAYLDNQVSDKWFSSDAAWFIKMLSNQGRFLPCLFAHYSADS